MTEHHDSVGCLQGADHIAVGAALVNTSAYVVAIVVERMEKTRCRVVGMDDQHRLFIL